MKKLLLSAMLLSTIAFATIEGKQCTSKTSKNIQCKNTTIDSSGLCHYHNPNAEKTATPICSGTKKDGNPCGLKTTHESGKCHHHRN